MNAPGILSYTASAILSLCALVMALSCCWSLAKLHMEYRRQERDLQAAETMVRAIDEEEMVLQLAEARLRLRETESRPDIPVASANCIAFVNPDGSVAVAREMTENKSIV